MKQLGASSNLGKSSIKSVAKSATKRDGKTSGLKSNNGIENAVSGVTEKTKSEGILEALFEFEANTAQEFAQRDVNDYVDSLRSFYSNLDAQGMSAMLQSQQSGSTMAGILQGSIAGGGVALAGLMQNRQNDESQETQSHGQNQSIQNSHINQEQNLAQNQKQDWNNQGFETIEATNPEQIFGEGDHHV